MEKMVFKSPKRHRIIAIKQLLAQNNIPVTSIKLHIHVEWTHWRQAGIQTHKKHTETREKRNELNVPIEEFTDTLNDAQTFELYTTEDHEDAALELIEACDEAVFFGDCIFRSEHYDEAFQIYTLLNRNNIPCDEIFPGVNEYLLFIDPVYMNKAIEIIEQKNHRYRTRAVKNEFAGESFVSEFPQEQHRNRRSIFRYVLPAALVLLALTLRINDESLIEILLRYFNALLF